MKKLFTILFFQIVSLAVHGQSATCLTTTGVTLSGSDYFVVCQGGTTSKKFSITTLQTWLGANGSGTVTSFSSGNLSPLFTTSVSNATSTPALSFTLSNASAHTIFGNFTGSSAAPSYNAIGTGVDTWISTPTSANLATAITNETGSGSLVFATSPTLTTPLLGTPTSGTLTNCTGLPVSSGISGLGTGIATFLATPSSANLSSAITDETGSGALVFGTSPTLTTPLLGTPTSGNLANCTFPTLNQNTTGTAAGWTTGRTLSITGDLSYTSPSWDGTANVTAAGTLATVNSNVGTFGSATKSTTFTVNGKGLITAASEQTVTPAVGSITGLGTGVATWLATPSSANLASAMTDETGSGALAFATSPTLVTPLLGTPTSGTLTNCTGLPISSGVSGLGVGAATFLATPSSANFFSMITDETGGTLVVGSASPTFTGTVALPIATMTGKMTNYNNVATVSNGIPSEYATVDLTSQTAAITATTLYATGLAGAGIYRVSFVAKVTTAATTSSTLGGAGGFQVLYTDQNDAVVVTTGAITNISGATLTGNTTQIVYAGSMIVNAKASSNIQYQFGYTSSGIQPMNYNMHIKVEAL